MPIAVMSDLHDNVANWNIIASVLKERGISTLLNCGDTCAPAMLQEMSATFPGTIHTVFGNVADRRAEQEAAATLPNVMLYGDQASLAIEGVRIALVHEPFRAEPLIASGEFDLVCHGHTHLKRWEALGGTHILNPGTAGGMFQYPSFAVLDFNPLRCAFHEVLTRP